MTDSPSHTQAEEILDVILSYAKLDFSKQCELLGKDETVDAIAVGVNMLGEELQASALSIKEKEQLLMEIHHRVKNNMQIISSMMRLHASMYNDERIDKIFNECQSRITAMAIIHEMLYNSSDYRSTKLDEYVWNLTESIDLAYNKKDIKVTKKLDIPSGLKMDIDTIIPLGLMINEIVSNSYKHAFKSNDGEYYIKIDKQDSGMTLTIGDDGAGFDRAEAKKKNSLGLELIQLLSEQIEAKVECDTVDGTSYTVFL